ncbi:winged helix-turn-helix transcriptional regulator, partial [Streptomyces flaveus]|uniref:winged helix-turn-helix transcriptional regulator n=1 Tax=Streptomyces flaveus TaxID=66370 RepID=UPI00331A5086
AGILKTVPYQEPGSRSRNEYRLTRKGWDLWPALMALSQWGEAYALGPEGPVLDVRHTDCDAPVRVVVECSTEHSTLTPRDVTARLGTGARPRS